MKKYILSLFALLVFITPVVGLSANGLTDSGTVNGEKQSPLYRLFYKEHRITSNDSIAYEDSDGTEYSFSDIFEDNNLIDFENYTDTNDIDESSITSDKNYVQFNLDDDNGFGRIEFDVSNSADTHYYSAEFNVESDIDGVGIQYYYNAGDEDERLFRLENSQDEYMYNEYHEVSNIFTKESTSDIDYIGLQSYDGTSSEEVEWRNVFLVDMEQFDSAPSQSSMDTYRDVYTTVEDGETYYYYTFDGGFISILWVAVLFSGSYLYIRKAEVEDTKQAIVQASIFFIIGLVLLRVIQTII